MAATGGKISAKEYDAYKKALHKSAASGGLRTEIESGTEAPAVLMPGSTLKKSAAETKPLKVEVSEDKKTPSTPREEQIALRNAPETEKQKKDRTKKQHEDYFKALGAKRKELAGTGTPNIIQNNPYGYNTDLAKEIQGMERQERVLRARAEQAEQDYIDAFNKEKFEEDMAIITGLPEEQRLALERYSQSKYMTSDIYDHDIIDEMREEYGQERLDSLEGTLSLQRNEQHAKDIEEKAAAFVEKQGGRGTVANLASVPVAAYSGLLRTGAQLGEAMIGTRGYIGMDPYVGAAGDAFIGGVRGQTSENIAKTLGDGFVGNAANIGYQAVMSYLDNAARATLGGGSSIIGATLAGTSAFSQTVAEASAKGADFAEAAALGTVSAFIEYGTEKMGLDSLIGIAGGEAGENIIRNIIKNAGVEIAEEEISLIANVFAEAAILQEKGSFNQSVNKYILEGKSPEEARRLASDEIIAEALNTALVTGFSGALGGYTASLYGKNKGTSTLDTTPKTAEELKQQALDKVKAIDEQNQTTAAEPAQTQQEQQTAPAEPAETVAENATTDKTEAVTPEQQKENVRKAIGEAMFAKGAEMAGRDVQQDAKQTQTEAQQPVQTETAPQTQQDEQPKSGEYEPGIKGTGAAEQNFTGTAAYENLLSDENVQHSRPGDVRDVEVPKTDTEGKQVSEAAGNIMNSGWTPDAVTDTIKKMVMEGKASHDVMSNEQSLKTAAKEIENEGGAYASLQAIKEKAAKGWTSRQAVAKAELIYRHLASEVERMESNGGADEDTKNLTADAFVTLCQLATNSGQSTQLFSVFRRMTPEIQLKTLERNAQRYIDEINTTRVGKKKAAVNAEAKQAQKPVEDAIKTARKETSGNIKKASDRVRVKGGKVTIEGNQNGEPFVFEYAQKVGEALAKGLENNRKPKPQKTFLQTMTAELKRFAKEKMPPSAKSRNMTDTELLKDYIQNQEFYAEAWGAAQQVLREKYGDDPYYQEFINSGIGVDGNANPQNRIMARAIAKAAIETGETADVLRRQQALGITGMADTIANKLIRDTGATGEMAQTIRDAAKEFVTNKVNEADSKPNAKNYDPGYFVNEAMRDIQKTMSDVAKQNERGKANVKQAVVNALTRKYGFGQADASHIAEVVGNTFDQKAQEQARKILEQKFGEREKQKPRSAGEMIEEYANLGAYDENSQYSDKATESFIRAAMQDINKTVSDLAKSSKADREAVKSQISNMITQRHGIAKADADHIAEVVGNQLTSMVEGRAKQILEQKFADKPKSAKKTALQMMTEFANLGAFDVGSEYNERATAKIVGEKYNAKIRDDLTENFLKAKTDEAKAEAMDEIYKDIASQISPTLEEAWDAWRNMAMLLNPKTHERNFLSTGAFKPYAIVKRDIAAVIETLAFVDKENRTRSVLGPGKKSVDLLKWAKADAKSDRTLEAFANYGKGGNEAAQKIQEYRQMMLKPLDTLGKLNQDLMSKEDLVWKRNEYAASLASFLKSRGYTAEHVRKGMVPEAVMNEGRQLAINDAMKATFNDRNRFSDAIANFRAKGNDPVSKSVNMLAKGILPYARTPANILVRVKEYSPVEVARGFYTLATKVRTGEATISQGIDQIASGLTGVGAMILGAALRDGLIPGVKIVGLADEEEKEEGATDFSIKIGDTYCGIGSLAPACIPLFIGAELKNTFSDLENFSDLDAWEIADAMSTIGSATLNPMLELSMLSSLNSAVEAYSNAETPGEGIMNFLITAATNYFTQGLPTILGQAEQATETDKTSAFVNTDNTTEKTVKTIMSNAAQRIPGVDLYRTEKLDEWGQPVKKEGDMYDRVVESFLNPFSVTKAKTDNLTKELSRLNKAQEDPVSPPIFSKVVSYTDKDGTLHSNHRLSEEEYQKLAQTQGQTAKAILESMISSKNYAAMNDEQKAKAVKMAYSYAREKAMVETFDTSYSETWMMKLKGGKEAQQILQRTAENVISNAVSKLDTAWDSGYSKENTEAYSKELEKAYESYSKMDAAAKREVKATATGTAAKCIEAREKGISHADFVNTARNVNNVKGTGTNGNVRDIDKRQAIAKTPGLTTSEADRLMKVYMPDYDHNDESPETTEFKYQYIREELGLSPQEYVSTYRAYLDNAKKNQRIKAIQALGYDYSTARKLYNVYYGNMKKQLIEMYG